MKYFAGLDVSQEETAILIVDEDGRIVKEARADSEPEAVLAVLSDFERCFERLGLQACSPTAWLHEGLISAGLLAICIESRHAKAAMGAMPNKTDRNDAPALARIMRSGWFCNVHVKSASCRAWRSLPVARRTVRNELRTIEKLVRAVLREVGLKLKTPSRKDFVARARDLIAGKHGVTRTLEPLLEILATMLGEFAKPTKRAFAIVQNEPVCRLIMSAAGVGPRTALTFRARRSSGVDATALSIG